MSELYHYASKYYDPVKAHQYYEEHKELVGRRSTSKLNDTGKEAWKYVKENITKEKKGKVESLKNTRTAKIAALRSKATETRNNISENLKRLNEALSESSKQEKESISERAKNEKESITNQSKSKRDAITSIVNSKIKQIQNQSGLTADQKKLLIADIRESANLEKNKVTESAKTERNSVSDKATSDKANISAQTQASKSQNQNEASEKKKQVASELKASIQAARDAYNKSKSGLDASYEQIYQKEYDKILSEHEQKGKHRRTKKKS